MQDLQEELDQRKEHEKTIMSDNQQMTSELGEAKIQLEKIMYENKEGMITADSLKESNQELSEELDRLRQALTKLQQQHKENATSHGSKDSILAPTPVKQVDESVHNTKRTMYIEPLLMYCLLFISWL